MELKKIRKCNLGTIFGLVLFLWRKSLYFHLTEKWRTKSLRFEYPFWTKWCSSCLKQYSINKTKKKTKKKRNKKSEKTVKKKGTYELSGPYGSLVALLFIYMYKYIHKYIMNNLKDVNFDAWKNMNTETSTKYDHLLNFLCVRDVHKISQKAKKNTQIWERNRPWWWRWRPSQHLCISLCCWLGWYCRIVTRRLILSRCKNRANIYEARTAHITSNTGSHS